MTKPKEEKMRKNRDKIILDLCGGTGSWSLPYKENGYEVYNITLPKFDIFKTGRGICGGTGRWLGFRNNLGKYEKFIHCGNVYGILFAPPCAHFSFARTNAKTPRDLQGSVDLINAGLEIINWCLFNEEEIKEKDKQYIFNERI